MAPSLQQQQRPAPALDSAPWFSRLFFHWVQPIISKRRNITEDDLNELQNWDQSQFLANRFLGFWHAEQQRSPSSPSVGRAIFRTLRSEIIWTGVYALAEVGAKIAEAVLLGYIIQYFRIDQGDSRIGYAYASGLVVATFLHSILHHQLFFVGMRMAVQIRTMFIATIYRKALALSAASSASAGTVVNLVSNDVATFEPLCIFGHFAWTGILEIILCTGLLYWYLGWPAFVGLAVFALLIPLQGWFANLFAKFRGKTVSWRDSRIRLMSDLLVGINVVKFSTWELPFSEEIRRIRDKELKALMTSSSMEAFNEAFYFIFPYLISLVTFGAAWLAGRTLLPERVFPAIGLFNIMRLTMTNFFPKAVKSFSESRISCQRIGEFLVLPEVDSGAPASDGQSKDSAGSGDAIVRFEQASFSWKRSSAAAASTSSQETIKAPDHATLRDITLDIPRASLVAVIGPVGCGKSSLLNAILGEMEPAGGRMVINSAARASVGKQFQSYASQSSWIIAGTVRDNIVFGSPRDDQWFWEVIKCCELERDLELWENGIDTVVGERGVMLSGGQRARICLARAIYARPALLLLDDPLSAVDTRVARRLFDTLRSHPALQHCTRVLVTHQLQFVRECDQVVIIEGGSVVDTGSWDHVLARATMGWRKVLKEYETAVEEMDITAMDELDDGVEATGAATAVNASADVLKVADGVTSEVNLDKDGEAKARTNENEETAQIGHVQFKTYADFLFAPTPTLFTVLLIVLLLASQAIVVYSDWHLTIWVTRTANEQTHGYYPLLYLIFVLVSLVLGNVRAILSFWMMLRASGALSRKMLFRVLRAPMSWFASQPTGRILNRFSRDQSQVDELLPAILFDTLQCFLIVLGNVIVVVVVNWWVAIAIPILGAGFVILRTMYIHASRQVKRFEAITRSPVYSQLSESLEGLPVIRAFRVQEGFTDRFMEAQNHNTRAVFAFNACARWLGLRLDLLSTLFLAVAAYAAIAAGSQGNARPGQIGLALSYVLQLNGLMQWMVRQSVECEIMFVAVERMLEYSNLESEPPEHIEPAPRPTWPEHGEVVIEDMSLTYPGSATPVLKNWNVVFPAGHKVGIVGRTGAGKSSFFLSLFRMYEFAGRISIDGIDTKSLGVKDLRASISIIPQEPFLFKGTLRFNLDPFSTFSDQEVWHALEAVELKGAVERLAGKLDAEVTDNGKNFSVGERQLLCLARAILKKSKVIVLDEATANVDYHTDSLIQESIRTQFRDSLVLTIAHRLSTVFTDYDKILVLNAGEIAQYGHAYELLQDRDGLLAKMVDDTGEEAAQNLRDLALQGWKMRRS
ncbi:hypothetical protein RI367_002178 [Sorochytrium milnesiophthora]